jgi:hypothetical protein
VPIFFVGALYDCTVRFVMFVGVIPSLNMRYNFTKIVKKNLATYHKKKLIFRIYFYALIMIKDLAEGIVFDVLH